MEKNQSTKKYTVEEYYACPFQGKWELSDGVIYVDDRPLPPAAEYALELLDYFAQSENKLPTKKELEELLPDDGNKDRSYIQITRNMWASSASYRVYKKLNYIWEWLSGMRNQKVEELAVIEALADMMNSAVDYLKSNENDPV